MDNEAIVMRQQMDKTLAGLTDKLGKLERQVLGTVRTVNSSVNTVRDTFDLKLHVRKRPWTILAGVTAVGFLVGAHLSKHPAQKSKNARLHPEHGPSTGHLNAGAKDSTNETTAAQDSAEERSSWLANLGDTFQPEIAELRGIVIGALLGIVRDIVVNHASAAKETSR